MNLPQRYGKGTWAVISGCNDLGVEYALKLASQGFNLVIVDGSGESLNEVKNKVQAKHSSTQVISVQFDHQAKDEWKDYETLCKNI